MVWTSKIKLLSKFSLFIILTAKIKFHKVFKLMTYEIVNFSYGYLFFTQKHPYFCYIQGLFIHSLLLMYTVVPLFLILYFLFSVHSHFFLNIWRTAETFMLLKFWHKNMILKHRLDNYLQVWTHLPFAIEKSCPNH